MIPWADLSVGVAVVVGLVLVVRYLGRMQAQVLQFMGNHLSLMTKALQDVATNLSSLNERVDRLHDDNIEAAQTLKRADARAARKAEEQNNRGT